MAYFVGVDVGTTGTKALVVGPSGVVAGSAYVEYGCTFPRPGWVEQDVGLLVDASLDTVRQAIVQSGIDPAEVRSVSFSSQRCCTILVDEDGQLIRPMISWQDNRPVEQVRQIEEQIGTDEYFKATRFPLSTTWVLPKIMWLQQNEPENWDRTARVVQLQDYLLKSWGADGWHCDHSDTGFHGMWDTERLQWDERLLKLGGLSADQLSTPAGSTTPVGSVSSEASARSGLPEGTPLFVGAGDQNAAALGAGLVCAGQASVSIGTAGSLAAFVGGSPVDDPTGNNMLTNHVLDKSWLLEGYLAASGGVLRWFRDEIATLENAFADKTGADFYAMLDQRIADVPAGARGLLVLPHWASAATPRWDPNARGVVLGLSFSHDSSCLARAFMEGITLAYLDMLNAVRGSGLEIKQVRALGGATKSKLWNQMQADMYGCPVQTLRNPEAGSLGAAMIGAVGCGHFGDFQQAADSMVHMDETFEPNPENAGRYQKLYDLYNQLHTTLADGGVFDVVAGLQHEWAEE